MKFKKLLEPIKINRMTLRNRIVMTAMHLGMAADNGEVTPQLVEFYAERARGGVGLILAGECFVTADSIDFYHQIGVHDDSMIPSLARLAERVHAGGAKLGAQIIHGGRHSRVSRTGETPLELTKPQIFEIVTLFAAAAARVKAAGFDAVEIGGSGGALISEFFSPLTNLRTDEYGGSLANRARLAIEIVRAVRAEVGPDFPILFRLSGHQLMPGGYALEENREISRWLVEAGVDCINVSAGWEESPVPQLPMEVPPGAYVFLARGVKEAVDVPVIACVRINDPVLAEKVLGDGCADLVAMSRAMIADPELPAKVGQGRLDEIRKCVGCNQECLDKIFPPLKGPVGCLVNFRAGRESVTTIGPASSPKRVVVVGGGPAGLEAARVLALRGHEVILYEESERLGGQLNLACLPPGKQDLASLTGYLRREVNRLGVRVKLGTRASTREVIGENPDAVLVATGARPGQPEIPGIDRPEVVSAWAVLNGQALIGDKVLIVGGGAVGVETALWLAKRGTISNDTAVFLASWGVLPAEEAVQLTARGKPPIIVEMKSRIAEDIGPSRRWVLMHQLKRHNVVVRTNSRVESIGPEGVRVISADGASTVKVDNVVIALGAISERGLGEELISLGVPVIFAGDCVRPRKLSDAIREGFESAFKV